MTYIYIYTCNAYNIIHCNLIYSFFHFECVQMVVGYEPSWATAAGHGRALCRTARGAGAGARDALLFSGLEVPIFSSGHRT